MLYTPVVEGRLWLVCNTHISSLLISATCAPAVPLLQPPLEVNSPASVPRDPISQLSCPWMERGPASGCPAHTKGQVWQVRACVITQSPPTESYLCDWGFQDLILSQGLAQFQNSYNTLNLRHMWGQCMNGHPWILNQISQILKNAMSERRGRKWMERTPREIKG